MMHAEMCSLKQVYCISAASEEMAFPACSAVQLFLFYWQQLMQSGQSRLKPHSDSHLFYSHCMC